MLILADSTLLEWGITLDFAVKESKMNELLSQWPLVCFEARVPYALFGGTALNKAFLNQPRFSEDADFFVYGKPLAAVDRLVRRLSGFDVQPPQQIVRGLHRWTLQYRDSDSGVRGEIQLDINLHFKKPVTKPVRMSLRSFLSGLGGFVPPRVDVLPKPTLLAMKLLALQGREEGKDFYDLYRLLSLESFRKTDILCEARKYADSLFDFQRFKPDLLDLSVASAKKADARKLAQTDAYIFKSQRPDWEALKKDVVRLLRTRIR